MDINEFFMYVSIIVEDVYIEYVKFIFWCDCWSYWFKF